MHEAYRILYGMRVPHFGFGNAIYEGRSIDRALWVYGHSFSEGKKVKLTPKNPQMKSTEERTNAGYSRAYWEGTWKKMGAEKFRGTKNGNKPACHEFSLLSTDAQPAYILTI